MPVKIFNCQRTSIISVRFRSPCLKMSKIILRFRLCFATRQDYLRLLPPAAIFQDSAFCILISACPLFMVGLGRLELPTSPLSGVRSSHLSYRPGLYISWWSWSGSNRRPPECKSGALPAELQPPESRELRGCHKLIEADWMQGGRLQAFAPL